MDHTIYELTVVYPLEDEGTKLKQTVKDILKKLKAEVVKEDEWGTKRLAYKIRKHTDGDYIYTVLQMDEKKAQKLTSLLRLERGLLRWLLVLAQT